MCDGWRRVGVCHQVGGVWLVCGVVAFGLKLVARR